MCRLVALTTHLSGKHRCHFLLASFSHKTRQTLRPRFCREIVPVSRLVVLCSVTGAFIGVPASRADPALRGKVCHSIGHMARSGQVTCTSIGECLSSWPTLKESEDKHENGQRCR